MSRTLIFVAEFTKSKVKTTPANAPTIDIADMLAPTGSLLVSGGSPTQLTNLTGVYVYSYSAADSVLPVAVMRTADTTVDLQDVPCLALAYSTSGFVKSAPQTDSSGVTQLLSDVAALPTAVNTTLTSAHGSGAWGAGGNGGALTLTYTLTSTAAGNPPIEGATVELYSDSGMSVLIAQGTTNALGVVTFNNLVAGTYYLKRLRSGYTFTNPDTEVVA